MANNYFTKEFLENKAINFSFEGYSIDDQLKQPSSTNYDFFISHSFQDKEYIEGLYNFLTSKGKRVYVDWIVDDEFSREDVTEDTAQELQGRMDHSTILIYAISQQAAFSKWMPWELGYFNGKKNNSAIKVLPITENADDEFVDQEFTQLYEKIGQEYFE